MKRIALLCLILLTIAGCTLRAPQQALPSAAPSLAASATTQPTLPPTITPTPEPTPTPSPTPYAPFTASTTVDNVNVRSNPGYLFQVERMINQDVTFQVLGRSPGGEWLYIQTQANTRGWVFAQLVKTDQDLKAPPVIQPEGVQEITGILEHSAGVAISGVQFMITQTNAVGVLLRTDAMTDETGVFHAYLPLDADGSWKVEYTAVACTSNTMDENCNCKNNYCGSVDPAAQTITLPRSDPLVFNWK